MSSLLVIRRSEFLAAATLWSGGDEEAGLVSVVYETPAHRTPVLAAWGGADDIWGGGFVDFRAGAASLTGKLEADGHVVVRCDHGLGHTVPWDGPGWGWDFLLAHTWAESDSPWAGHDGAGFPDYCEFPEGSR